MPKQYRLKGASLEEIRDKAVSLYGPAARIVAAEKVTNPGFGGLFAKDRFEAMVEVPQDASRALSGAASASDAPRHTRTATPGQASGPHAGLRRPAIAALLEQADENELRLHGRGGTGPGNGAKAGTGALVSPAAPGADLEARPTVDPAPVSTSGPDFAGLLAQLGAEYGQADPAVVRSSDPAAPEVFTTAAPAKAPSLLAGPGDIVLLLGLGDDALGPALEMSLAAGGCDVRTSGGLTAFGHLHVADRQSATTARASAVATGQTVLLAFGLGRPRDVAERAAVVDALGADQVWAVVDARRKADDTAAWLTALRDRIVVDAIAVVGGEDTLTPETADALGLPVGWRDGRKVD